MGQKDKMRIALSSYTGMGAWWVLRLRAEGHDVDYYLSDSKYEDVLGGLIPPPKLIDLDHRRHNLGYGFPSYKNYDLSLFDLTGRPRQADSSRSEVPTLGDGTLEHMLEDDREFGIKSMEECGINVPPYTRFNTASEAKAFLKKNDKAYVFKPFTIGGTTQDTATTYVSKSAADLIEFIDPLWAAAKNAPFILQEFIKGTEIGTEAFFNGIDFFLITGTLEEKKFMNDNKGPNTGCSGNLIVAMHEDMKLYTEGLKKAAPLLRSYGFRGIIDLNTIVTENTIYGLEWTPRFGYLCCPTIATMYGTGYGDLLRDIAVGHNPEIKWGGGAFGAAVTMTIPPYPTEIRIPKAKDIPIEGVDPKNLAQLTEMYLFDAMIDKKKLVTSGNYGYIGAVMSAGHSVESVFKQIEGRMKSIHIPNCQYRTDIEKSTTQRYEQLRDWGWLR
jgi:phosphoribosylamine---glycine ligase